MMLLLISVDRRTEVPPLVKEADIFNSWPVGMYVDLAMMVKFDPNKPESSDAVQYPLTCLRAFILAVEDVTFSPIARGMIKSMTLSLRLDLRPVTSRYRLMQPFERVSHLVSHSLANPYIALASLGSGQFGLALQILNQGSVLVCLFFLT